MSLEKDSYPLLDIFFSTAFLVRLFLRRISPPPGLLSGLRATKVRQKRQLWLMWCSDCFGFASVFLDSIQPTLGLHIPDGFLSLPVSLFGWIVAVGLTAVSLKQVESVYGDRTVSLMGVCAAFIFAAQMINFPIPGGTSGHLLGGTLAGALLGPWAGSLVMIAVFMVQAVLFQDGGLTVLGPNIFVMGLIGTFGGYYVYRSIRFALGRDKWSAATVGLAVAAWLSVVVAAVITAVMLALSGTVPLGVALIAMVGWHVLIGIGEALITVAAIGYVWRTRPDLLFDPPRQKHLKRVTSRVEMH